MAIKYESLQYVTKTTVFHSLASYSSVSILKKKKHIYDGLFYEFV